MEESDAATPAWDWGEQRVTVGRHFIRDMEGLWSEVLKLAAVVEEALNQSIHALCDGRVELADQIRLQKPAVDRWEVQIKRECVHVLALHQPVASDLRRVAAVLKINGDLERLADLARHIAKRVKKLAADPLALPVPQPLENLGLEAFDPGSRQPGRPRSSQCRAGPGGHRRGSARRSPLSLGAQAAQAGDRSISGANRRMASSCRRRHNLERIADHASKIAEAVVYLREGEILRHRPESSEDGHLSTDRSRTRPKLSQ